MITVTLFVRPGCPACDQARADLAALQNVVPHRVVEIDVEADPALRGRFTEPVPMLQIGPYRLRAPFTRQDLQVSLSAAQQRSQHMEQAGDERYRARVERGQKISRMDRLIYWMTAHYMLVINLALFLYAGLPFTAPLFEKAGLETPARVIYAMYRPFCHQLPYRSFFLFGQQLAYPRELAHLSGLTTYEQIAPPEFNPDTNEARFFTGNPQVGYKIALCERDVAIWGSLFLFGLIYVFARRKIHSYNILIWMAVGLIPIALDGGTQLLGAFPFLSGTFGVRESTPFLRVLTGSLFGVSTGWYLFPLIEESMVEMRNILAGKFAAIAQKG